MNPTANLKGAHKSELLFFVVSPNVKFFKIPNVKFCKVSNVKFWIKIYVLNFNYILVKAGLFVKIWLKKIFIFNPFFVLYYDRADEVRKNFIQGDMTYGRNDLGKIRTAQLE